MDRKALIREYKETRRPMGVFRLYNKLTGKSFVGRSVDLPAILNRHRAQLRMGVHASRELQQDWNDLGPDAFDFEILDELPPPERPGADPTEDLKVLEQLWLDRLSPYGERGYNVRAKPRE